MSKAIPCSTRKSNRWMSANERFEAQTDKTDGCWEWGGYRQPNGYGVLGVNGRKELAHRFSYARHVGPIPAGMYVCHRCDNRRCVRPDHLFLGTAEDNMQDCRRKGRLNSYGGHRGENHPHTKITAEQVREIRRRVAAGETQAALGVEFGMAHGSISRIVHRKTWGHIT